MPRQDRDGDGDGNGDGEAVVVATGKTAAARRANGSEGAAGPACPVVLGAHVGGHAACTRGGGGDTSPSDEGPNGANFREEVRDAPNEQTSS